MKVLDFIKIHGLGNDFVLVDGFQQKLPEELGPLAKRVCHRQFGVGADGLVIMVPSDRADFRMRIFNPDGSEPEMCGNAIRCVAKYAYRRGRTGEKMAVETLAGLMSPELIREGDHVVAIKVDMGRPGLAPKAIPMAVTGEKVVQVPLNVNGERYFVTGVSMGNPHCILFVEDVKTAPVLTLGPKIENHPLFPAKTNVEFVQVLNKKEVNMRVWERGVGETLACGTGASATAVACVLNKKTDQEIVVHLSGGDLRLLWDDHVFMTGPAEEVFEGKFYLS